MQLVFLVNDATELKPSQTTTMLIGNAAALGHDIFVAGVRDISIDETSRPLGLARKISAQKHPSRKKLVQVISETETTRTWLDEVDFLVIRTNPARDLANAWAYQFALQLASICKEAGVCVLNDPHGLIKASSKLYLMSFPEAVRPRTLVSQQPQEIKDFIQALDEPAVLKPLQGTRGNDVFFVSSVDDPNLNQIVDVILRQSAVMVQECVPGAEAGDVRVVVMNGEILEIDGKPAAINRVPGKGELRSNIHKGGTAKPAVLTSGMRDAVKLMQPRLQQDGLFLVGLDFIGEKVIEINVFSTGGLRDAERFYEAPYSEVIIREMLKAKDAR